LFVVVLRKKKREERRGKREKMRIFIKWIRKTSQFSNLEILAIKDFFLQYF